MNRFSLFLMLMLCMSVFSVTAQLSIRPYAGLNSSTIQGEPADIIDFDSGTGFQVGVDMQLGNRLYVQPGVQLEFLKNNATLTNAMETDGSLNRTGVRIPVMVGYRVFSEDSDAKFNLRLFTGPNAFLQVSANSDNDLNLNDNAFNDVVWGWNAGAGLDISILFVDVGYQAGITNLSDNQQMETQARNNVFYGNAGLRLFF